MSNNNTNSNKINVPEARAAMEQYHFEENLLFQKADRMVETAAKAEMSSLRQMKICAH